MPESPCRRVILKPDGLSATEADRLADALQAAIAEQNRLATQTPHVLRFLGPLTDAETAFWVEHEQAEPLDTRGLFDPQSPGAPVAELLAIAAGMAEALQFAHRGQNGKPVIHGGVCPGILLRDPAGVWKVTDFGFVPAHCTALGVECCLHLAVGGHVGCGMSDVGCKNQQPPSSHPTSHIPHPTSDIPHSVTGAWQRLPPDEFERDDRICAFIDPEKYAAEILHGPKMLAAFEPGSDLIAMGFLLYLLAEHNHPYLFGSHDAHRVVEMSRMMASSIPFPLMRKDLAQADDPAIRAWRECVYGLLSRLPADRPPAAKVTAALAPFAPTIDKQTLIERQDHIVANRWLTDVRATESTDDMDRLEALLSHPPAVTFWPAGAEQEVEKFKARFAAFLERRRREAEIQADHEAAQSWFATLEEAVAAEAWDDALARHAEKPDLRHWPDEVTRSLKVIESRLDAIRQERADHKVALDWVQRLDRAIQQDQWREVEGILAGKPKLASWPDDALARGSELESVARPRLEAIQRDHRAAEAWLARIEEHMRANRLPEAIAEIDAPPDVADWPPRVREKAQSFEDTCRISLSDDILVKLEARTQAIRNLARTFFSQLVRQEAPGLLDPERLEVTIDAEEFAADEFGAGRAQLVVNGPTRSECHPERNEGSPPSGLETLPTFSAREPFEYHVGGQQSEVRDPEGRLAKKLSDDLRRFVIQIQRTGLEQWFGSLRAGMFPQAAPKTTVRGGGEEIALVLIPMPKAGPEDAIDVTLRWNPRELRWEAADEPALFARLVEIARQAALTAARAEVLKRSTVLARYAPLLGWAISPSPSQGEGRGEGYFSSSSPAPPPARKLPTELKLDIALTLNPREGAPAKRLHVLAVRSTQVGRVEVPPDLRPAETPLVKEVVAAQTASRDQLMDDLEKRVALIVTKSKVKVEPRKLREPTDQITFDVSQKKGPGGQWIARWSAERFRYELAHGWEASLLQTLQPPPPPPPPPESPPVKKAESAPETKAVQKAKATPQAQAAPDINPAPETQQTPEKKSTPEKPAKAAPKPKETTQPATAPKKKPPLAPVQPSTPAPPVDRRSRRLAIIGAVPVILLGAGMGIYLATRGPDPSPVVDRAASATQSTNAANLANQQSTEAATQAVEHTETQPIEPVETQLTEPIETQPVEPVETPPTPIEITRALLASSPPPSTITRPLTDLLAADLPDTARSMTAVFSAMGQAPPPTVTIPLPPDAWQVTEDEPETPRQQVAASWDAGTLTLVCTASHDDRNKTWQLTFTLPQPQEAGDLAGSLRSEAEEQIQGLSNDGRLADAHKLADVIDARWPSITEEIGGAAPQPLATALPPAWQPIPGFQEGGALHPSLGYPTEIVRQDGGTRLLLVALTPKDPLRQVAPEFAELPPWLIIYVADAEWPPPKQDADAGRLSVLDPATGKTIAVFDDIDQARKAAADQGLRLPTAQEWLLAALQLWPTGKANGLAGGLYEWCEPNPQTLKPSDPSSTPWVCGGYPTAVLTGISLPSVPNKNADPAEVLRWLEGPLVRQQRIHGDGLVGMRPVLAIHPR